MKKIKYIIFFLLIIIILLIIILSKNKKENITYNNPYKEYSYYKEELLNDYIDYYNKKNLSIKDTIIRVNIGLNNPFYTNTRKANYKDNYLILVNKYCYIDKNYVPSDLISFKTNGKIVKVRKKVYDSFINMQNEAKKNNLNIRIISGYRDYLYQENLYNKYLKNDKKEIVDTYSARAGFSEHQTGLSIDIDNIYTDYNKFYLTNEYKWMMDNAYKYGFILRYPKNKEDITGFQYESWHYRYVGVEASKYIHDNNITFDEYYYEFVDK